MDWQSTKSTFDSSMNTLETENFKAGNSRTFEQRENSERTENQTRKSIDEIIKKYEDNKINAKCTYSDQKCNEKVNTNDLPDENLKLSRSFHIFYNYIEPKYLKTCNNRDKYIPGNYSHVVETKDKIMEDLRHKVNFKERKVSNQNNIFEQRTLTSREKLYVDKTTYCRPVASLYNEEFIYKTMERNARLKRLVKNLAIARQREKENVNWNNFINELKNKHGPNWNGSQRTRPQYDREKYITPEVIDDSYNTKYSWQQSGPCSNLLQDFYGGYYIPPEATYYTDRQPHESKFHSHSNYYSVPYNTNLYCYPTASQGRLIMLDRERQRNEHFNRWHNRFCNNNIRNENNHTNKKDFEKHLDKNSLTKKKYISKNDIGSVVQKDDDYTNKKIFRNKATNKPENLIIDDLIQTECGEKNVEISHPSNMNTISLMKIENKLETLIDCINSFIEEIKLNRRSKRKTKEKPAANACEIKSINKETDKEDRRNLSATHTGCTNQLLSREILNDSSESTIATSAFYPCAVPKQSEVDAIFKEIDKFCPKDISQPCSVNITFEVPTRDCSTEVTKSLSKQQTVGNQEIIEEISTPEHTPMQQMTIAVNTDPFNFLSLLRISTEALMRLLSNVPTINYHSYLGLLPFQQITRKVETDFICNVCGAAFNKPSALSDHIRAHDLGKTRECCVCRQVLNASRWPAHLFRCRVCGQRFTRAYCCELHQRCCGRGSPRDAPSGLVLLT